MIAEGVPSGHHRLIGPDTRTGQRLRDLLAYRELLQNLIRKELKVKYKNSSLGFVWSLLNPALYLVIFWVVFTKFLGNTVPLFAIFFLSGLLGWNLFSASLGGAVGSMVGNASLVTKVYFPREVLPLAAIGANLVHFGLHFLVLVFASLVFRAGLSWEAALLIPFALAVEIVLLIGVTLILSVTNVYFRDVQHLLELALLAWFWMTPIVYPVPFVLTRVSPLLAKLYFLNPMNAVVLAFQRAIYGPVDAHAIASGQSPVLPDAGLGWYLTKLGSVGAASLVLLVVAWAIFRRLESRVAEEL